MKTITITILLLAVAGSCPAETLIMLEDFEGAADAWPGTSLVPDPVHSGRFALRWKVAARAAPNSPGFLADWTKFDELRFRAYLSEPVDFRIPLVFIAKGGYYLIDWKLKLT